MTPQRLKEVQIMLGLDNAALARALRVTERSIRNWQVTGIDGPAEAMLELASGYPALCRAIRKASVGPHKEKGTR
jgi:DNA-binding transcriptional regulator YiaG